MSLFDIVIKSVCEIPENGERYNDFSIHWFHYRKGNEADISSDTESNYGDVLTFPRRVVVWCLNKSMVWSQKLNFPLEMKEVHLPQFCDYNQCALTLLNTRRNWTSTYRRESPCQWCVSHSNSVSGEASTVELQLPSNNMTRLPILRTEKPTAAISHVEEIKILQQELNSRLQDIRTYEDTTDLHVTPFDINF